MLKTQTEKEQEYKAQLLAICQRGTYLYFTYANKLVEYIEYIAETNQHKVYVLYKNNQKVEEYIVIEPQTQVVCGIDVIHDFLSNTIVENQEQIVFLENGGTFKDINLFKAMCYEKQIDIAKEYIKNNPNKENTKDYENYLSVLKIYPRKKDNYMKKYEENREILLSHLKETTPILEYNYEVINDLIKNRKPLSKKQF